ncbi:aldo/keto reductase [Huintestinicola sp.]|uniref:aldo/keto reductase n=1 Tax=Huintestinicola sp. TaxID=2981661 RepID=UPI003D7C5EEB
MTIGSNIRSLRERKGLTQCELAERAGVTQVYISYCENGRKEPSMQFCKKLAAVFGCPIDLMLIHQPFNDYYGTYRAMEEAYKGGKIRAIGVSNFYPDRLIDLCKFTDVIPAVDQVETHVFRQQKKAHEIMKKYSVAHESWGPFAEGRKNFFSDPVLNGIGAKHGKTAAQTALRFLMQSGVIVIPKSVRRERMEENLNVFDFSLTDEEMSELAKLDENESAFFSHYDPDTVEFLTGLAR